MIKHQEQVFVEENLSNLTSPVSGEASVSSSNNRGEPSSSTYPHQLQYFSNQQQDDLSVHQEQSDEPPAKKKRNLPGNPDPESEVIALSPKTLLATNRFVCEICNKGFQRDQNLQLHRRGHNLPWKLKQRSKTEVIKKKVYVCPEPTCVHNHPSRALGDLTGIKKHFSRKHGEKKWKCDKCSKKYAVQSDWKAHSKVCGTREYRCDCGTLFSRRDSFITHRAFCDALAEETARAITTTNPMNIININPILSTIGPSNSNSHFMNMQQQQHDSLHASSLKRELQHHPQQQHQPNLINLPPWLSCPPMDNTPHHQDQQQQYLMMQQIEYQQNHQNPSNPNIGPTFAMSSGGVAGGGGGGGGGYHTQAIAAPHMSATALLQKAAQMGATMSNNKGQGTTQGQGHVTENTSNTITRTNSTAGMFGLNLSSRDQQQQQQHQSSSTTSNNNHGLSSFGNNKAATPTPTTTSGPGSGPSPNQGPSAFLQDMMVNSISSSYDDALAFQQALGSGRGGGGGGGGGGSEGLTRDFLGLTPLSQNDIFTLSGYGNCMTTTNATSTTTTSNNATSLHQQETLHKPW
ncbi:protein indeterminate-domain 7-like [Silene latifolia]|uniref:protein indeterminate-domain 7-like n=1 Tax=Silene latifolia TaxID=37657 RepID=UPI003D774F9C